MSSALVILCMITQRSQAVNGPLAHKTCCRRCGIDQIGAAMLLVEIGADMSRQR